MSIKKDIESMIKNGKGDIRLNEIAMLNHFTIDGLGNQCDVLTLRCQYICGVKGGKLYTITARDYDGIIREVSTCLHDYMTECADAMEKNLINGYR